MRGRRLLWLVGAVVVVALGGWLAVWAVASDSNIPPLHAWVADAENPRRLRDEPGGPIVDAWEVTEARVAPGVPALFVARRPSLMDRLRLRLGMSSVRRPDWIVLTRWRPATDIRPGWSEYVARSVNGDAIRSARPDAALAGRWVSDAAPSTMVLRSDGRARYVWSAEQVELRRWVRVKDLVLTLSVIVPPTEARQDCAAWVVAPDDRTMRDGDGAVWRKVE